MTTAARYAEALDRIAGPDWWAGSRHQALERFLASGLPGPRDEAWRYTSLEPLGRQPWHAPGETAAALATVEDYPGALLAFSDGRASWQDTGLPPQILGPLATATDAERSRLASLSGDTALAQLNLALWQAGVRLHVPADERLRQPVFLRHAAAEAEVMLHPRLLVVMEPGADAVLIEHYDAETTGPHWQNAVAEIYLEPGARLTHIRLIEGGEGALHTHLTAVRLAAESEYRALDLALGGRLVRHDLNATLAGAGAHVRLDGLFVADGRRHVDHHLQIDHAAPRTTSRTTWRGMASGRGRGIFDARVVVRHGASQADARQSSRNLLLSPHAEIDAKPHLEIYTDDVKCGHGATVGQLDEAALFYLASRGIGPDIARDLLLAGFAGEALALLDDTGLREWFAPRLRLPGRQPVETPR